MRKWLQSPTSFHLYCWADVLLYDLTIVPRNFDLEVIEVKKAVNDNLLYKIDEIMKIGKSS